MKVESSMAGLDALHDIVIPEGVSSVPQTAGWYILFALLLCAAAAAGWLAIRRRRRNLYRAAALAELAMIERDLSLPEKRTAALGEIPVLLKRTALMAAPRETVASLTGQEWAAFLDRTGGREDFRNGRGRLLLDLTSSPAEELERVTDDQTSDLTGAIRRWIDRHRSLPPESEG